MLLKVAGFVVVLICLGLAVISADGLVHSQRNARMMSLASESIGQSFEASDWQRHWQFATGFLLGSAIAGIVAGLGLIARRRWAVALLAAVVTANLGFALTFLLARLAKYRFEVSAPGEIAVLAMLSATLWFSYVRMKQRDPANGSAP